MNNTRKVYADMTLRFTWKNDFQLHVYIPDEFERDYQIYISNDGYLMIER